MQTELPCGCFAMHSEDIPTQYMMCPEHKQNIPLVKTAINNLQQRIKEEKKNV